MAFVSRGGKGGSKASGCCFSQPSGAVRTTSSNSRLSPSRVETTSGPPTSPVLRMFVTTVSYLMSAPSRAGLAMCSRIFSYVPLQNRFSAIP